MSPAIVATGIIQVKPSIYSSFYITLRGLADGKTVVVRKVKLADVAVQKECPIRADEDVLLLASVAGVVDQVQVRAAVVPGGDGHPPVLASTDERAV